MIFVDFGGLDGSWLAGLLAAWLLAGWLLAGWAGDPRSCDPAQGVVKNPIPGGKQGTKQEGLQNTFQEERKITRLQDWKGFKRL